MPIVINSKTSIKIMDTSINVNYYVDCASYGVMALPPWYRPKMIKSNLYSKFHACLISYDLCHPT